MSATAKLAISVPAELVAKTRRAVCRGAAASVSAYVTAALEEKVKNDDLAALLEEMLAETGGPLTTAERKRADRLLGISPNHRKK